MIEDQSQQAALEYAATDKMAAPAGRGELPADYESVEEEPISNVFDRYEEEYQRYMEEEWQNSSAKGIKPAIWANALFKRPKMPVLAYIPDFIYAGAVTGVFAEPKAGKP